MVIIVIMVIMFISVISVITYIKRFIFFENKNNTFAQRFIYKNKKETILPSYGSLTDQKKAIALLIESQSYEVAKSSSRKKPTKPTNPTNPTNQQNTQKHMKTHENIQQHMKTYENT